MKSDIRTIFNLIGKRPRRLLAHVATCFFFVYLLYQLARKGVEKAECSKITVLK
jgi:hypothetical protein